jgi:hypothetical protein
MPRLPPCRGGRRTLGPPGQHSPGCRTAARWPVMASAATSAVGASEGCSPEANSATRRAPVPDGRAAASRRAVAAGPGRRPAAITGPRAGPGRPAQVVTAARVPRARGPGLLPSRAAAWRAALASASRWAWWCSPASRACPRACAVCGIIVASLGCRTCCVRRASQPGRSSSARALVAAGCAAATQAATTASSIGFRSPPSAAGRRRSCAAPACACPAFLQRRAANHQSSTALFL